MGHPLGEGCRVYFFDRISRPDGKRRIIGSVTSGFSDESAVVRDEDNKLSGRTSERYDTTRDEHGNLVSINSADPGGHMSLQKEFILGPESVIVEIASERLLDSAIAITPNAARVEKYESALVCPRCGAEL